MSLTTIYDQIYTAAEPYWQTRSSEVHDAGVLMRWQSSCSAITPPPMRQWCYRPSCSTTSATSASLWRPRCRVSPGSPRGGMQNYPAARGSGRAASRRDSGWPATTRSRPPSSSRSSTGTTAAKRRSRSTMPWSRMPISFGASPPVGCASPGAGSAKSRDTSWTSSSRRSTAGCSPRMVGHGPRHPGGDALPLSGGAY